MAKVVINPPAQLIPRSSDVGLTLDQLTLLGIFASLKKAPAFAKFPGTYILRHYRPGEVICRQGDAGGTAFYMLTGSDVASLAENWPADGIDSSAQQFSRKELERIARQSSPGANDGAPRSVATARLLVDSPLPSQARPTRSWTSWWRKASRQSTGQARPATIANDGPTDIDYRTRQAPIYEGEVFGEMSCLTRQPRSATIVVESECIALEFLRNILDQMRKDTAYKQLSDERYRQRVMEGHLRQLPIFKMLTDLEFSEIAKHVEFEELAAGSVLWDEGDASDSLVVVRSGFVQVVQSFPWRMTEQAVGDWPKLLELLAGKGDSNPAIERVRASLPQELQQTLAESGDLLPTGIQRRVVDGFNELSKTDVLLSAKELQVVMSDAKFQEETADFPAKARSWTGLQLRRGNRLLYHLLFPELVAAPDPVGRARVLQYLGRGGILGEIGLVLGEPRSATCVAYAHADAERESTSVELVRLPGSVIRTLLQQSSRIQTEIRSLATTRKERDRAGAKAPLERAFQSKRVEELGLQQGQNLMMIDLDRCTRCGDCVEACVATHDDGHSRLFLDGPRFGKYLIPSSCRLCRDPVCMIGCPVGSIQAGDSGEVVIRDWCIGCGVCARQCPYDSIQMHDRAILPTGYPGWQWCADLNVSSNAHWIERRFDSSTWSATSTPLHWGVDLQQEIASLAAIGRGNAKEKKLYLRCEFSSQAHLIEGAEGYELTATSQGSGLEIYLNGQPLELVQDAAQKKRGQYIASLGASTLVPGVNIVAAAVALPREFAALVFDLRIDRMSPEQSEFEEKVVTEQAVVCDQCSSLSGNRHACVYACPHEAALRIDGWNDLPSM